MCDNVVLKMRPVDFGLNLEIRKQMRINFVNVLSGSVGD